MAVAHNSKTVDTYRTGARCGLHWHDHRMVVGHGNSVLIVNSAAWCLVTRKKAAEAAASRCRHRIKTDGSSEPDLKSARRGGVLTEYFIRAGVTSEIR